MQIMLENVKKSAHSSSMHFLTEFFISQYCFQACGSNFSPFDFCRCKSQGHFYTHTRRDSHDDIAQKLGHIMITRHQQASA